MLLYILIASPGEVYHLVCGVAEYVAHILYSHTVTLEPIHAVRWVPL